MGSSNCKSFSPIPCGSGQEGVTNENKPSLYSNDYVEEVVCKENTLKENEMQQFDLGEDGKVLVVKQDGKVYALGAKCSHYGARLVNGALGKGRVRCPWHGACFNIATGDIEDYPGMDSIHSFKVILEGGNVKVRAKKSELISHKRVKQMARSSPLNLQTMVIIGGGPSGAVCAEVLRQEGFTGRITVICREQYLPYDRVKLSKQLHFDIDKTQLRSKAFYDEYDIEMKLGVSAVDVQSTERKVALSSGEVFSFTKLYIATGGRAMKGKFEGNDLENVMVLRETEDAKQALRMLQPANEIVVLGGSFISIEIASYSVSKVNKVTVVMRGSVPFENSFGKDVGQRIMEFCEQHSIVFVPNSGITKCQGENGVLKSVVLKDGTEIRADLLVMGLGTLPNTEFLKDSGIKMNTDGSVVVDRFLKTNVDNIYAGGDIAYAPVYSNFNQSAAIGHYPLAHYHGRIAAMNMLGKNVPCKTVPYFWTMIFGKSLRYTGYGKFTSTQIEGNLEEMSFVVFYFDEQNRVIALMSLNRDPVVSQYAEWLANGKHIYKHDLQVDPFAWTRFKIE